jgi:hypothetical protein
MIRLLREKRRSKRKRTHLEAELVSDNQGCAGILENTSAYDLHQIEWYRYLGIVENISHHGIFIRTLPARSTTDYSPGTIHELRIQLFSGETVCLRCRVKWLHTMQADQLINKIGMEIIQPPSQYKKLIRIL